LISARTTAKSALCNLDAARKTSDFGGYAISAAEIFENGADYFPVLLPPTSGV